MATNRVSGSRSLVLVAALASACSGSGGGSGGGGGIDEGQYTVESFGYRDPHPAAFHPLGESS